MLRPLFLAVFLLLSASQIHAQSDATCDSILKIYNTLGAKDKVERNKYKISPATTRPGTLGDISVYKSSFSIPGFSNPEFIEGGGEGRRFSTYIEAATYDEATKLWENLNKKLHAGFTSTWSFTENNNATELYKSSTLIRDGSFFSPTIRYRLIRAEGKFRLMLEILYS